MRPVFTNRVCGLMAVILLAAGAAKGVLAASAPSLKVTVQAAQQNAKNGVFLPVVTRIQNNGDTIQTLHIWSCSHERNWKTDSLFVRVMHGSCKKDAIQNVKLEAGETYEHTLHLSINVSDREVSVNSLSFRLGFTDGGNGNQRLSAWSNPIMIKITE